MKKSLSLMLVLVLVFSCMGFAEATSAEEKVVIEFAQWWEPEFPEGKMREIVDGFESENPGIQVNLISNPYNSTHDLLVASAATGTMSDVVGVDGTWVYDLSQMNALLPLDEYIAGEKDFTIDEISTCKVGETTYMIPVVVYSYHLFCNKTLLAKVGIKEMPRTWSEFMDACQKINDPEANIYGWMLALSNAYPSSSQDQFMSWAWASGSDMYNEGKAVFASDAQVSATAEFFKSCYDAGVLNPGVFSLTSSDMMDTFANGYAGFMVSTCAAINSVRAANPSLDFTISAIPTQDGYAGESGIMYAPWGIGISSSTKHPQEAWEFVSYLMKAANNTNFAQYANALPGNSKATVNSSDEAFLKGFDVVQNNYLINEMQGLPQAEDLMKNLTEEIQLAFLGDQTVSESLTKSEAAWNETIAG
ncbi:MAG: sugar ABC transporter substrate-binding protein [Clostridia bacterium]